jgi:hypothetical protein
MFDVGVVAFDELLVPETKSVPTVVKCVKFVDATIVVAVKTASAEEEAGVVDSAGAPKTRAASCSLRAAIAIAAATANTSCINERPAAAKRTGRCGKWHVRPRGNRYTLVNVIDRKSVTACSVCLTKYAEKRSKSRNSADHATLSAYTDVHDAAAAAAVADCCGEAAR